MSFAQQSQFDQSILHRDQDNYLLPSDSQITLPGASHAFLGTAQKKKVTDLSRNLLVIVCEYLSFFEIVSLTSANRKLLNKLDDSYFESNGSDTFTCGSAAGNSEFVSYVKRRGTLFFQSFFFQQFPSSEVFIKRMTSLTTTHFGGQGGRCAAASDQGLMISASCFLPFVKQSSVQEDKRYSIIPLHSKQSSTNPFDLPYDVRGQARGSTVTTAFTEKPEDDPKPINYYINETYKKWKEMYLEAINNKNAIVEEHQHDFYTAFLQHAKDYSREIFLDPTLCENPCFALPQLTRENYNQKGLFYRTEKVLVQNFSNCFQRFSVDYTRKLLWDTNQGMQDNIARNEHARSVLAHLLTEPLTQTEKPLQQPTRNDCMMSSSDHFDESHSSMTVAGEGKLFTMPPLSKFRPTMPQQPSFFEFGLPSLSKSHYQASPTMMIDFNMMEQSEFDLDLLVKDDYQNKGVFDLEQSINNLPNLGGFGMPTLQKQETKQFGFPPQSTPLNFSLPPSLQKIPSPIDPPLNFELIGLGTENRIITNKEDITILYRNIASYTLRQFKLLCTAHKNQLDFILEQIRMAPSLRKNYFMYLEDYVQKEKNLRYLLRKVSQNFIMQEAFSETMLRNNVYQVKETQKQPYLCDFLLLEYLDSIWINEVYRPHSANLIQVLKDVIRELHTISKFDELEEKKEIIRKVINIVHQSEFNIKSNADFLSISMTIPQVTNLDEPKFLRLTRPSTGSTIGCVQNKGSLNISGLPHANVPSTSSAQQCSGGKSSYQDLVKHIQGCVKFLLKQMQIQSHSINEYIQLCSQYEGYQFQKLEEVELFYLMMRKHYLGKSFAYEFSVKLENNKFARQSLCTSLSAVSSSGSNSTSASSNVPSRVSSPIGSNYQNLSLNQVIHPELIDSFFHLLVRRLIKDDKFKEKIDSEQLLQSLFVLFHIEQNNKSQFANQLNRILTESHAQIEELIQNQPELVGQLTGVGSQDNEETKSASSDNLSKQNSDATSTDHINYCPFSLIASDEDDEELMMMGLNEPNLQRGYSDQKRTYFKGLSSSIFKNLKELEIEFDFKNLILQQRQMDKKRVMDEIQQRIESFNNALTSFNSNQSIPPPQLPPLSSEGAGSAIGAISLADIEDFDEDEDMLPDPSSLALSFSSHFGGGANIQAPLIPQQSWQRQSSSFSFTLASGDSIASGYQANIPKPSVNDSHNGYDNSVYNNQQQRPLL